jgi:glycosyltransferase involved in cell wall biosynthesis
MISNPLVSILMINKNHGHYLEKTIQSYLSQSYSNLEIIIVDGGSTDSSMEIAKKYTKVKFYSSVDKSGGEAFVKCLNYCESNLVMFATSNDVLVDTEFICRAVAFLVKNDEYACVFGNVIALLDDEKFGDISQPYNRKSYFGDYNKNFKRWLISFDSFHECATLFNKSAILHSLGSLDNYLKPIDQLRIDMFLELRFGFFSNGYKAKYIDSNVIAVRDHFDRVSVESRSHFLRHLNYYNDQVKDFRRQFIKKNHSIYVSPAGKKLERISAARYFFLTALIIRQVLINYLKKRIKILLKYKTINLE